MTERKKYDFESLQNYCNENNVVLLEDYTYKYVTRNIIIKGKCVYENCNNEFEKIAGAFYRGHNRKKSSLHAYHPTL